MPAGRSDVVAPEVVVVGGGVAGATVAALLALRGRQVTVFERRQQSRPTGAAALPAGVHPVLTELGLRARLLACGAVRSKFAELDWGNGTGPWRSALADSGPFGYGFHIGCRELTDLLLVRATELGASVRKGQAVLGPVMEGDVVVGVRHRDHDGREAVRAAGMVVDASGSGRVVAGVFAGPTSETGQLYSIEREHVVVDVLREPVDPHTFVTARAPDGDAWTWVIPLGEGIVERGRLRPAAERPASADRELWSGYRSSALAGQGWLSVGDAAGAADPLFLSPAALTMLSAHAAAGAVESELDSAGPTGTLRNYSEACDDVLGRVREFAEFCLDSQRQSENEDTLVRNLTGLLSSRESGGTLARVRGALDGSNPLLDADCPEGPLVASLAMPDRRSLLPR
ncbi:Dehydrogenase (flavoprotein) [Amycolatopsis marina]|uniref:Dehydrogenase (Flavoprotein) n=1 Tax=Amycolatopsis marina TaxID=490629 RepID=A0A1I1BCY6_9PSEU|nr:FAD-dependent oxidoreductase [Amycolatopsis marina]SFB47967.1 Dehydrogenase (flavoprotein) [Amycolatopsis marina]